MAHKLTAEAAIQHIDIGGPAMLRAAAKNWQYACRWSLTQPTTTRCWRRYADAAARDAALRRRLAAKTFTLISAYDGMIAGYLAPEAVTGGMPQAC